MMPAPELSRVRAGLSRANAVAGETARVWERFVYNLTAVRLGSVTPTLDRYVVRAPPGNRGSAHDGRFLGDAVRLE